jgi:hypothetical protein
MSSEPQLDLLDGTSGQDRDSYFVEDQSKPIMNEEEGNVIPLATANKFTPDNWLAKLPVGTQFTTRPRNSKHLYLDLFYVTMKNRKTTALWAPLEDDDYVIVETQDFSKQMELVEVLDGRLNRTI